MVLPEPKKPARRIVGIGLGSEEEEDLVEKRVRSEEDGWDVRGSLEGVNATRRRSMADKVRMVEGLIEIMSCFVWCCCCDAIDEELDGSIGFRFYACGVMW